MRGKEICSGLVYLVIGGLLSACGGEDPELWIAEIPDSPVTGVGLALPVPVPKDESRLGPPSLLKHPPRIVDGHGVLPQNDRCDATRELAVPLRGVTKVRVDEMPPRSQQLEVGCGQDPGRWPGPQLYYRVTLQPAAKYVFAVVPDRHLDVALYAYPAEIGCNAEKINRACATLHADAFTDESPIRGQANPERLTLHAEHQEDWIVVVDSQPAREIAGFTLEIQPIPGSPFGE